MPGPSLTKVPPSTPATPPRDEDETSSGAIEALVSEHHGWAHSIARSVARAWNLDADGDGLASAALEALLFCARRYDTSFGAPFRGYARRRIHEGATEEARRTKGWRSGRGTGEERGSSPGASNEGAAGGDSSSYERARDLSAQLLDIFPELRDGRLPAGDGGDGDADVRGSIRGLLVGAALISTREGITTSPPDEVMDYKKMVEVAAALELLHQVLLWRVYWEGLSLRSLATEWETDELNVMREHKALLSFLYRGLSTTRGKLVDPPKVRPGLRQVALRLKREFPRAPFSASLAGESI